MKLTILLFLILILTNSFGCSRKKITAEQARNLEVNAMIKLRHDFVERILTEIIPNKARHGYVRFWVLDQDIPLNSDDAKEFLKLGYKIEMCIDKDRIAYVYWN